MRRRNRDKGDSLTLFPFLAVLICTMGSLIVLLVIIVQQAKVNAKDVVAKRRTEPVAQTADGVSVATVEEVEDQLDEVAWRIEILETSRAQTVAQLDQRRDTLAYLEDEIRQMRDKLDRAAAEAKQIQELADSGQAEQTDADAQLARLREELQYAEEDLEQARQDVDEREPSYALVAYDGSSGTRRRPIYVECREDRITLQPEGIVLTGDDFREPLTDDNALASALRAQREYLKDAAGSNGDPPYPLIVVRPDGAQAYAAARAAMKSWDTEFGYELIDDQVKLAYPDSDDALAAVTREAVEESRARRKMLQQIAPARFGRSVLTASRSGGFQSRGGGSATAQRNSTAVARNASQGTSGIGTSGNTSGYGSNSYASDGNADPYAPQGNASNADAIAGEVPGAGYGTGQYPGQANAGDGGRSGGNGQAGRNGGGGDSRSESAAADSQVAARLGPPSFGEGDGDAANGSGQPNGQNQTQAGRGPNGQAGGGSNSNSGQAGGATGQGESPRGSATAGAAAGRAGGAQSGQANGGSGSGGGAGNGNAGSGGGARSGSAFGATAPIAGSRGSNWALPGRGAGTTGITRPINMTCYPDRLIVIPENRYRSEPIDLFVRDGIRPQIEPLVKEVNARIERWGIAGNNMYWKPVLQVDVQVGAGSRFEELAVLLRESGIVVLRK